MFVEIENLAQRFDELTISFSARIERGEMLVVTGHSGSGKSTVLRMIAGLLPVQEGNPHICIDGADVTTLPSGKRGIGMVFQSPSLFLHMTVEDNVAYGLVSRGMRKADARQAARTMLSKVGLAPETFARRYPESLSGGEAQRVSLARTLIVEPRLVLFDEPFSALDAPLRKKLGAELLARQKELGFAGILVTHDLDEARALGDRITVMSHGAQTWTGAAQDFNEALLG